MNSFVINLFILRPSQLLGNSPVNSRRSSLNGVTNNVTNDLKPSQIIAAVDDDRSSSIEYSAEHNKNNNENSTSNRRKSVPVNSTKINSMKSAPNLSHLLYASANKESNSVRNDDEEVYEELDPELKERVKRLMLRADVSGQGVITYAAFLWAMADGDNLLSGGVDINGNKIPASENEDRQHGSLRRVISCPVIKQDDLPIDLKSFGAQGKSTSPVQQLQNIDAPNANTSQATNGIASSTSSNTPRASRVSLRRKSCLDTNVDNTSLTVPLSLKLRANPDTSTNASTSNNVDHNNEGDQSNSDSDDNEEPNHLEENKANEENNTNISIKSTQNSSQRDPLLINPTLGSRPIILPKLTITPSHSTVDINAEKSHAANSNDNSSLDDSGYHFEPSSMYQRIMSNAHSVLQQIGTNDIPEHKVNETESQRTQSFITTTNMSSRRSSESTNNTESTTDFIEPNENEKRIGKSSLIGSSDNNMKKIIPVNKPDNNDISENISNNTVIHINTPKPHISDCSVGEMYGDTDEKSLKFNINNNNINNNSHEDILNSLLNSPTRKNNNKLEQISKERTIRNSPSSIIKERSFKNMLQFKKGDSSKSLNHSSDRHSCEKGSSNSGSNSNSIVSKVAEALTLKWFVSSPNSSSGVNANLSPKGTPVQDTDVHTSLDIEINKPVNSRKRLPKRTLSLSAVSALERGHSQKSLMDISDCSVNDIYGDELEQERNNTNDNKAEYNKIDNLSFHEHNKNDCGDDSFSESSNSNIDNQKNNNVLINVADMVNGLFNNNRISWLQNKSHTIVPVTEGDNELV
jgi:hypothetical protein